MGKFTSEQFPGLLGFNKKAISQPGNSPAQKSDKKKWSFLKSYKEKFSCVNRNDVIDVGPNKHKIAVVAAHAVTTVVRLTSSGRATTKSDSAVSENATVHGCVNSWVHVRQNSACYGSRQVHAAVKIQSHFRGHLSKRALRALKALVKVQALVRGYIVRKQIVDMIQRMHTLLRVQARARAGRSQIFDSPLTVFKYTISDPVTPRKFEPRSNRKEISNKIVQTDTCRKAHPRPHIMAERRNLLHSSHFTGPIKKDVIRSCSSGYLDQPNYMSVTESSKAKIRSLNENGFSAQRVLPLHDNFTNKVCYRSDHLDRLGVYR